MPARLDKWSRIVRKKPQPVVLDDDAEARLQMSETEYRRELFSFHFAAMPVRGLLAHRSSVSAGWTLSKQCASNSDTLLVEYQ